MDVLEEIKQAWGWAGIEPEEIVGDNEFGNLMIKDSYGKYWRLCPEDLYCKVVAESRETLNQLSTDQDFLEEWYMQALVQQAQEKLGPLEEGRKYCLVTPGALGGEYAISNVKTASLTEMVRFSGDLALQIKDLPDGAQIQLEIIS